MARLGKVLVLLACVAYPFLLHRVILAKDAINGWYLLLLVLPLLIVGAAAALRALRKVWWPLLLAGFAGIGYFIVADGRGHLGAVAVNGMSHALLNLFLLWFFARTLQPGREPLVTQISRRINGEVAPDIARYTRHVTIAWCIFFAGQVVVSALLYSLGTLSMWSLFVNVLNLPLLALMFVGEYAYRVVRYPAHAHASILKAIEVYAKDIAVRHKADTR